VVEDASNDGKIMTRAELPGQVSRDILFYSCDSAAKTRNPFKPRENFHTGPMMKDWLIDWMPVTGFGYVMTVDGCSRVIDVVAEVGVSNLLHREAIFPSGNESCRGVYVTLVEDLMYHHDQEIGESVEDRMKLQVGIHHDESC
jgi:hypothetical protein